MQASNTYIGNNKRDKIVSAFQLFTRLSKLFLIAAILLFNSTVYAQGEEDESKTKFMDKIGHWFVAYGMSGPEFINKERLEFKSKAFAEVYVEGLMEHDAWMFNLLNKITKFRYEAKQNPHILIEVSFKPVTDELNDYNVLFKITSSKSVSIDLDKIGKDMVSEFLSGTYAEPQEAVDDIEKAIQKALTTLAEKLGDQLAPDLMVKYDNEIFWDGHDIHILDDATNTIELEAIGKDGNPLNATDISWTNASPIASSAKATVDIRDITNKEVVLNKGSDNLTVNVTRLGVDPDINELLKQLLIELLTVEQTEAQDTIVVLRQDSIQNLEDLRAQLALLEQYNFPLENADGTTSYVSELRTLQDSSLFLKSGHKVEGFRLLRKRRRLTDDIKRKVNVAIFADLIVDEPERIKDLLDELVRNSGRLIARLILGRDSDGQRDAARDIVVDFLNRNLDRIANANTEDSFVEAPLPVIIIEDRSKQPTFNTGQQLYISDNVQIEGKDEFIAAMNTYLNQLPTPTVMVINYSQDVGTGSYQNRTTGARPVGLPTEYDFITINVVNIPGSVKEVSIFEGTSPLVVKARDAGITDAKALPQLVDDLLFEEYRLAFMAKPYWERAAEVLEEVLDAEDFYEEVNLTCSTTNCIIKTQMNLAENASLEQEITLDASKTEIEVFEMLVTQYHVPYWEAEAAFTDGFWEATVNWLRIKDAKIARGEGWEVAFAEITADIVTGATGYPTISGWITGDHWRTGDELTLWEQVIGVFDVIPGEALAKAGVTALVIKIGDKFFDFRKVTLATRTFLRGTKQAGLKVIMKATNEVILYGKEGGRQIGRFINGVLQDIYWVYGGERVLAKLAGVKYIISNKTVDGAISIVDDAGTIGLRLAEQGEEFVSLAAKRLLPGKASGIGTEITDTWLKGSARNAGFFPKSIADKLKNIDFKDFNEFRQTFWKTVADEPNILGQFDSQSVQRMQNGFAPFTEATQQLGGQKNYILHHITPINQGGAVYDMSNLMIVTPRYHKEILDPAYHYGYGY